MERVLTWMNHQKPGKGSRSTRKARHAEDPQADDNAEEKEEKPDATVWSLLSIVASRDLHCLLQSAMNLLLARPSATPRRLKDLMEALQMAALLSIEGDDGE